MSWGFEIFDASGNLEMSSDDLVIRLWHTFTASTPGNYNYPQPLEHEPVVVNFINEDPNLDQNTNFGAYAWRHRVSGGMYVGVQVFEPLPTGYDGPFYFPTRFVIFARG